MTEQNINTPVLGAMGRTFDAGKENTEAFMEKRQVLQKCISMISIFVMIHKGLGRYKFKG